MFLKVQYETDETVVSGEERRGGPYKTATIIGYGDTIQLGFSLFFKQSDNIKCAENEFLQKWNAKTFGSSTTQWH